MNLAQINILDTQLRDLYENLWPGLTPGMAKRWLDVLKEFESHVITTAVLQWSDKHTFRVPGVQDLLTLANEIDDAQQIERTRQLASARQASQASYNDVLETIAQQEESTWAHLHVQMFLKGVCMRSRYEEAAFLCDRYAEDHHEDAEAWRQEAAWWRGGAVGKPGLASAHSVAQPQIQKGDSNE